MEITSNFHSARRALFGVSKRWRPQAKRWVVHVDMDAYFASVEQSHRPHLKGKPVIVLADPFGNPKGRRSVVAASSYEAKKRGVKAGMPLFEALKLCPEAVLIEGNPHKYLTLTKKFFSILSRFTDKVELYSVDEAFLDITHTYHLFGGLEEVGKRIKSLIKKELSITCSVGIAPNKLLAKMASKWEKPDGLVVVREEEVPQIIWPLSVDEIPGIGEKRKLKLQIMGIERIRDLANFPLSLLRKSFGVVGEYMYNAAWGRDDTPVISAPPKPKSIGHSITLNRNLCSREEIKAVLLHLTDKATFRLRDEGLLAEKIGVGLRFSDLTFLSREEKIPVPTDETGKIFSYAKRILEDIPLRLPVRLVSINLSSLLPASPYQPFLFPGEERKRLADMTKDLVWKKFGEGSLVSASALLARPFLSL